MPDTKKRKSKIDPLDFDPSSMAQVLASIDPVSVVRERDIRDASGSRATIVPDVNAGSFERVFGAAPNPDALRRNPEPILTSEEIRRRRRSP